MNLQTVVIILVSLMLASIGGVVFLNERNKRRLEYQQKLARLRQRADYIKEIALASEHLVDDVKIPLQLLLQASAMAKQIQDLAKGKDPHAQTTLLSNLELITRWETDGLDAEKCTVANNNLEAERYKKQLFEADRILQVSMQLGMINQASYQQLHDELAWSTLAIDARAHIKQGDTAAAANDTFAAQSHYRHARNNLEASRCKDPRCIELTNVAKARLDELSTTQDNKNPA
jgi:hypothetical protein